MDFPTTFIKTLLSCFHRPVALANAIYKLFTSTLTLILSAYDKRHQILHDSHEGLRAERCTFRQLKLYRAALEDAQFTKHLFSFFLPSLHSIFLYPPSNLPFCNHYISFNHIHHPLLYAPLPYHAYVSHTFSTVPCTPPPQL